MSGAPFALMENRVPRKWIGVWEPLDGRERIEFSWEGRAEMDSASWRGWAVIENEELRGRIFIHLGDDSDFRATRWS